jgi:hypothetical protein
LPDASFCGLSENLYTGDELANQDTYPFVIAQLTSPRDL